MSEHPAVRASARALGGTVWLSSALFGLYILAYYAFAVVTDDMSRWNGVLPMYEPTGDLGNASIGLHFLGGGLILVLGSLQFVESVRRHVPTVHRWSGRLYVCAALAASIGGLVFIAAHGTIGGLPMDVGFAGYGLLMGLAAVQTVRHAMARRFDVHRAWAIRLYALAIGSWLYRMDYGFWFLATDGIGHTDGFDGWFDYFMDFWFYLPNLVVAELWLRSTQPEGPGIPIIAGPVMWIATGFVILGTYFFADQVWLPGIAEAFASL